MSTLSATSVTELRARFRDAGYLADTVLERIGTEGQAGLGRNQTLPAASALGDDRDPLATLIRLWLLQQEVPVGDAERALPVDDLVRAGIVARTREGVKALVDVRPYGSPDDGADGWVVSDLVPSIDTRVAPTRPDYVLGVSPASTTLAQLTIRRPVTSALDLGTGCGVQSLHLARHADRVVATDLNPRCLELAELTSRLSGACVEFRQGSLYEPVAGQRFDLIVTNPPYVMSPPCADTDRLVYRESTFAADGLVEAVVRGSVDHLTAGGTLQVLANWAVMADQPWEDRIAEWVPEGCDALIMAREFLSPYEYAEMWLTDAGWAARPHEWTPRYRAWLDYFERLGIESVGMGWIEVQRHDEPHASDVRVEQWPWAVTQPVGASFAASQAGRALNRLSDADLLAARLTLAGDVIQETTGRPGVADPEHIVLRSTTGFRRAIEVDEALGGVLGACDGELPLGVLVSAVAGLLGADAAQLAARLLPQVRTAIADGLLTRQLSAGR